MTAPSPQQAKLQNLLRELFQLDQPDLDFGLYRIMHAKSQEIEQFLNEHLLATIQQRLGGNKAEKVEKAKAAYERERQNAIDYGGNPDTAPKAMQSLAEYKAAQESQDDDTELFDHLYKFFERYYECGDFLSRPYYARETSEKAAPYSVPYDGSEVYLHWANKDQYYIKTTENFRQFSVDLAQAQAGDKQLFDDATTRKVHFTVVEAEEGAHNNVKAASDKERYFILDAENPVEWHDGELTVRFHYRADPDKTGQAGKWREERNKSNCAAIFAALVKQAQGNDTQSTLAQRYHQALVTDIPKGKEGTQTLLAKYLNQYTAKNSMDYFIHKNLGAFLKRELDFYIKNELFRLDDLGNADAPNPQQLEKLLKKALTLRDVAHKLIEFLAQTEEFQKKLWLKKKFVVDTQWLVTLDKVPAALFSQIAANPLQWEQWGKLGMLDSEIPPHPPFSKGGANLELPLGSQLDDAGNTNSPPLKKGDSGGFVRNAEYLKAHPYLMVDTALFDAAFKHTLLATVSNLDDDTDGVLVHSENFQALNLMQARYREQVKCIYIDPPYNTNASEIVYKNGYKHSSWNSLIEDRMKIADVLVNDKGFLVTAIDHAECFNLGKIQDAIYGKDRRLAIVTVQHNPKGRNQSKFFSENTEYMFFYAKDPIGSDFRQVAITDEVAASFDLEDEDGKFRYENYIRARTVWSRKNKPNNWYPIYVSKDLCDITSAFQDNYYEVYPRTKQGDFSWKNIRESFDALNKSNYFVSRLEGDEVVIYHKYREQQVLKNIWIDKKYQSEFNGTNLLKDIVGDNCFDYPKSIFAVLDVIKITAEKSDLILDYFAGSGTTGHAVINLNREDQGKRKYLLVEMGDYFDTVTKPRIAKVIYSADWKDGKPTAPETGISQLVKVIRLESYEDTLNNLQVAEQSVQGKVIAANPALREAYFLHYLLELETKGSPSLLNIAAFTDPTAYMLNIKKPGSDAQERRVVDLVETFNWLLGLRVSKLHAPQTCTASFIEERDTDLPVDAQGRMVVKEFVGANSFAQGDEKRSNEFEPTKDVFWFRAVEGVAPADNGRLQRVLVVWRKLTGNLEQDNLVLEAYLREVLNFYVRKAQDAAPFEVVYVNGSHALPLMPQCEVRQLEEAFHRLMWDVQDV